MITETDVVVIGAGAAGLAAAAELRATGRSFVIVEARDRTGGRIFTARSPDSSVPVELGAEFIHGEAPITMALARDAGVRIVDVAGEHWQLRGARVHRVDDLWSRVARALSGLDARREPDRSVADYLRSRTGGGRRGQQDRRLAAAFIRGFDAADLERVSERAIAISEPGGEQASLAGRAVDGYDRVLEPLAAALADRLRMQTIVHRIEWRDGAVNVHARADGGDVVIRASAAIVTLPLAVLQARAEEGGVVFDPPLPAATRAAIEQLAMGAVLRVAMLLRERIWLDDDLPVLPRGASLRRMSFLHLGGRPWSVAWTAYPLRAPLVTLWAGGPPAAKLHALPHEDVVDAALVAFARALGIRTRGLRTMLEGVFVHDWQADPYARGAYSYATVGGSGAHAALGRPIRGTLHFAGEATASDGSNGTVEGALATGRRAGRRIAKR